MSSSRSCDVPVDVFTLLTFSLLQMYRLTIRATDETVPPILMKSMEERLRLPYPT
jgi:hypothetical protein